MHGYYSQDLWAVFISKIRRAVYCPLPHATRLCAITMPVSLAWQKKQTQFLMLRRKRAKASPRLWVRLKMKLHLPVT